MFSFTVCQMCLRINKKVRITLKKSLWYLPTLGVELAPRAHNLSVCFFYKFSCSSFLKIRETWKIFFKLFVICLIKVCYFGLTYNCGLYFQSDLSPPEIIQITKPNNGIDIY
ncbi:unnamed protein product [Chrysodeixis includens]|uniref:Uncharacterized protein n=1 Tax=Chrysodeixis includens TaxID=689277 RepID=A0A9N8KU11_CHRIL|nr:unnamed protein product [Chrysodeixis includens]